MLALSENLKIKWIFGISLAYILLNAVLIYFEFYYGLLLPVVAAVILLSFYSLDKFILFIVFLTPLSITLENQDFNLGLSLPTEPLMFGALVLFILKVLYEKKFDSRIINHPVSLAIIFSLFWTFVTTIASEMPWVSFKFFISRLWFVVPFYFFCVKIFSDYNNIRKFLWMYIIPFAGIIVYTVIRHAGYGFEHKPAHWVMEPFYKDHTSYGAMLVMFFPAFYLFLKDKNSALLKFVTVILAFIFLVGIIFSYTRAAWLSLAFALCLAVVYVLKIKFTTILATLLIAAGLFFTFKTDMMMMLEKNRQDSSNNLAEHVQSMSNVSSDASNLERINRWQSALRMFNEKPFFGWGPGTYSFQYAPFQHSKEKTIISTNAGDMGNAHSEYIGPLAEQGFIGMLAFLIIVGIVFYRASFLYIRLKDKTNKNLVLCVLLGFTTYIIHGLLNNFLDTDKAAVPFWGFVAILTAMDIFHSKEKEEKSIPGEGLTS